jgi:Trk K+ transport system NAD-binding subunit
VIGSALEGCTLLDANLRQRFGVIAVGIQRSDNRMEFTASPDSAIHSGDQLVGLGRADSLKGLHVGGPAR